MKSTLLSDDIILLLKDVSDIVSPTSIDEREKNIRAGKKAYEMIPLEFVPSKSEILFYERALEISADDTALAIVQLAELIYDKKGKDVVLVSLIRGGITAGILIKRYLEKRYLIKVKHYALTLVGTKGIDEKALEYILEREDPNKIQFVDGWTGKGSVSRTLKKAVQKYEGLSGELAVLSDPANILNISGTHEDILIANACLNAPLAGLISRAVPYEDSFFGAVFFEDFLEYDKTYSFIAAIEKRLNCFNCKNKFEKNIFDGLLETQKIAEDFNISDIHFIKPGMGETIRAFIRKKPDLLLVKNETNKYTELIKEIAIKDNIEVKEYPLINYNSCGIYKDKSSDVL